MLLCSLCPLLPPAGTWPSLLSLGIAALSPEAQKCEGFVLPPLKHRFSWVSPRFLTPPPPPDLTAHAGWGRGAHCSGFACLWAHLALTPRRFAHNSLPVWEPVAVLEAVNTEPLCSGYCAFPAHMLSAHTRRLASSELALSHSTLSYGIWIQMWKFSATQ